MHLMRLSLNPSLAKRTPAASTAFAIELLSQAASFAKISGRIVGFTGILVRAKDLRNYPMPPADAPLIPALVDLLG